MNRTFDYSTITALPKRETCKFSEFFTDFLSFFLQNMVFTAKQKQQSILHIIQHTLLFDINSAFTAYYILMVTNFNTNSRAIIVTMKSFFSNFPVPMRIST